MSTKSKGNNCENQVKEIFISWGFPAESIEKARPTYKPIGKGRIICSQNDFWGLFDLIVKGPANTYYIQVKHDTAGYKKLRQEIREFKLKFGVPTDIFILAKKVPRKGFKFYYIEDKGKTEKFFDFKGRLRK